MNHNLSVFNEKLSKLRAMPDKSIAAAYAELGISETARRRMMVVIRAETGQQTRIERFRAIVERVRARIGDRDPHLVSQGEVAKELGISPNQFWRARSEILRERRAAGADSQGPKLFEPEETPARLSRKDRPGWYFYTEGDRLFYKNREPAEVGA